MNVNITWLRLITLSSMTEDTCNSKVPLEGSTKFAAFFMNNGRFTLELPCIPIVISKLLLEEGVIVIAAIVACRLFLEIDQKWPWLRPF